MLRINLASKRPCPTCGGDVVEGFDGGNDALYEYCNRSRLVLAGPALKAWCQEHDKRCQGCDGRGDAWPPAWTCTFFRSPPRWLAAELRMEALCTSKRSGTF